MGEFCMDEIYKKREIDFHITFKDDSIKRCKNIYKGIAPIRDFFTEQEKRAGMFNLF